MGRDVQLLPDVCSSEWIEQIVENLIELIGRPTPLELSVVIDCEDVIVDRLCTVVEEAVLGILVREGTVGFDALKQNNSIDEINTILKGNNYVIFNRGGCWAWKSILVCLRQSKIAVACPRICSAFLPSSSD